MNLYSTNQLTLEHIHVNLRERLSDFREKWFANSPRVNQNLQRVDSLICTHTKKNRGHLRSHLRTLMALDHSRLGLENKFLEKKSGQIFGVWQVLNFTESCQQIWGACKSTFYTFYTSNLRWTSTMRRCFYRTDLGQNAVVHSFAIQIVLI